MIKYALRSAKNTAYRWLVIQVIVVAIISLLLSLIQGTNSGLSALLGGMVCVLPNMVYARRLFVRLTTLEPKALIKAFYRGEIIKLALMALLFILIFRFLPVHVFGFFVGFLGAQWAFWLAPFINLTARNTAA